MRHSLYRSETFPVSSFHLYSSWLRPEGADYQVEASYELLPGTRRRLRLSSGRCSMRCAAARSARQSLRLGPRPIAQIGARARILISSQAPGGRAHVTGVPFADRAGDTLCRWLGLDRATFHDSEAVAILPLGLCYPGRGAGGELPPRPECAPRWQARLREVMAEVRLMLLIGHHAQAYHLGARRGASVADTVRGFREYLPGHFPLPHPVAAQHGLVV